MGWLDNYNDSKVSVPEGFQGDGYSNVGRNYSPAWGGQFQDGGKIIKDNLGQWTHPGEITEIDSPYITMKGVPYPVLGISDEGDTKMMYPEEDYKFIGNKVTEYPMAKNGLSRELDQLTNFSNYNKKEKGGWLDDI